MSILNKIAHFQDRRDEVPNQELASELVKTKEIEGIREIAGNLWNENRNIQSDCLKVLYEIGYLDPGLIADYAGDFLNLLKSSNNRMVWGSMIALSNIAEIKAELIFNRHEEIIKAIENGSVITRDNGIKALAITASINDEHKKKIFPYLLKHMESCRPKDVPQHAEKIVVAVDTTNKNGFIEMLEKRMVNMKKSQASRVKKVIREAEKR